MPGMILPVDAFYTSTFEKDGSARLLGTNSGYQTNFTAKTEDNLVAPVSGNTLLGTERLVSNVDGVEIVKDVYHTVYCFDEKCSRTNGYRETFEINPVTGVKASTGFSKASMRNVKKQEWFETMDQVHQSVSETVEPSPYVEPPGVLTGGFITIVSVASIVLATAIFFLIYKQLSKKREKHLKYFFATHFAENIELEGSPQMILTADALQLEFERIDANINKDGSIYKEELWTFMTSGKIGTISDNDFDMLFRAIDLDKSGTIDFLEFCSFISICGTEMQHAVSQMENASKESKDAKISRASAIIAHNNFRKSQMVKVHPAMFEDDLSLVTEDKA
ncbi:hypothetical protein CTEN210_02702 [Chaetoceros tenuissimus]|uniref:EF-hand domain-containing protein n=1 Tax=Chaetoceros tenuissimus TaxID=426638 RepID=A0AAD3CIF6_9STRA|nr:hypothetical protein CTEN210_02702 [Chaetoceros tenuissimus]